MKLKILFVVLVILIILLVLVSIIILDIIRVSDIYDGNPPTVLNTREPQHLCAIFDRIWNSTTNTCDYMNELECGFILGDWNECKLFDYYCHPTDTLCEAPTSCISTCIFENSITSTPEIGS